MRSHTALIRLEQLFDNSPRLLITPKDKIVIFSDLHLGNGGSNDDYSSNSALFETILKEHYLPKGYKLILNGDVEELYKFSYKKIKIAWNSLFNLFEEFHKKNALIKITGNHDHDSVLGKYIEGTIPTLQSFVLEFENNSLFIYHGHQTANIFEQFSWFVLFFIRFLFRNVSNDHLSIYSDKKFKTEALAYRFAALKKIISILGHTHRPLFESMSKIDSLKMTIESIIRKYLKETTKNKTKLENQIRQYKIELERLYSKNKEYNLRDGLYHELILLPCLFNSGSVVGKHGITGIEISNGNIKLIYWFDKNRSSRYLNYKGVSLKRFKETDFYKAILKKDSLDYIFSKIKLMS